MLWQGKGNLSIGWSKRSEVKEEMRVMSEELGGGGGGGEVLHEGHSHGAVGNGLKLSLPFSRFSLLS